MVRILILPSNQILLDFSSEFKVQSVINSQILEQLQQIGKRLDKIENDDCKKTLDKSKIKGGKAVKSKKVVTTKLNKQTDKHDHKLPTFESIREDAMIQSKVEQRLQELSDLAKTGTI